MKREAIEVGDWVEHRGLYGHVETVFASGVCVVKFVGGLMRAVLTAELRLISKQRLLDPVVQH